MRSWPGSVLVSDCDSAAGGILSCQSKGSAGLVVPLVGKEAGLPAVALRAGKMPYCWIGCGYHMRHRHKQFIAVLGYVSREPGVVEVG